MSGSGRGGLRCLDVSLPSAVVCVCDDVNGVLFSGRSEVVLRRGGDVRSVDILVILADSGALSAVGTRHILPLNVCLSPSPFLTYRAALN